MAKLIIVLCGPDGSGKTTLATYLYRELLQTYKVFLIKIRSYHTIMYILVKLFKILGILPRYNSPYLLYEVFRSKFQKNLSLFMILQLSSLIPALAIRRIISSQYDVMIADRFTPDFLVDIYLVVHNGKQKSLLERILLEIIISVVLQSTRNSHVILMKADPVALALRRKDERLRIQYIKISMALYKTFCKLLNCITIDTTSTLPSELYRYFKRIILR